ncbi:MAG TPA: trypsin-like serine protease, partial [Polyangia bacterium]
MKTVLLAAFVGLSLGTVACGDGEFPLPADDVETKQAAIQGGQVETGYPAVGRFESASGSCTATLISQNFVLTASHCKGLNPTIRLGTDPTLHVIDQLITHPLADLMIGHLATPIENVPVAKFNEGTVPAVNTVCTSVGWGVHGWGDEETSGTKRSATERITASSAQEIFTEWVTGIADSGDSGGPLFCSGNTIAAVVKNHADGEGPSHRKE